MIKLNLRFKGIVWPLTILILLLFVYGCSKSDQKIRIDTEYKTVFLDNGQVFLGG